MSITILPNDVFLLVVAYLSPRELILCRRVSRKFHDAFTEFELNRHVLLQHYPRARELRNTDQVRCVDWSYVFSKVAGRYHHLKKGLPRSIEKLALAKSFVVPQWSRNYGVAPWQRHLQFEEKEAPFHYPDTLWTYEEGLLIFPSAELQRYALYDLEAGTISEVDFKPENKIIRRLRLHEKVLVVEWCENEPYHQLNENEMVYRHFATSYDVIKGPTEGEWRIVFRSVSLFSTSMAWTDAIRNEWKIHFLGMPLNSRDRFFSHHTARNYALYLWQPNRSAWGEDEPIEALAVWDISSPSAYLPSQDPSGKGKPDDSLEGPRVMRRFSFKDLDFYRIRQRSTPMLRGLELDESHVYVIEEDHRWIVGQQAGHALPRLHKVKTIGIPFVTGPMWVDSCGADGDNSMSFCQRISDSRCHNLAPCWRHEVSRHCSPRHFLISI